MHILDKIVQHKRLEIDASKRKIDVRSWQDKALYHRATSSAKASIAAADNPGIIAEHKRRSPSKPAINLDSDIRRIAKGYTTAGAAAMSVLTDSHFFGGSLDDLVQARSVTDIPLLRKDFIIDHYQIEEARAHGADLILLISELLDSHQVADLGAHAQEIGLEVLLEMHTADHIAKSERYIDIVGINNRDLTTFTTDIQRSLSIAEALPSDMTKISESGLKTVDEIKTLIEAGFDGFLIGETFMKSDDPGDACAQLITSINL
jgi:indole-3-glycerol phosphate synthase